MAMLTCTTSMAEDKVSFLIFKYFFCLEMDELRNNETIC